MFFFISLILFHTFGIQNVTLAKELGNLVYAFFLLIRSFCFMLIIVVINSLLLYLIKDKIVLILDILLLVGVIDYSTMFPILSLSKNVQIPLFISGYFISFSNNFSLELCISLGYLLLSIIFCYILYKTVVNQNKNMIDN